MFWSRKLIAKVATSIVAGRRAAERAEGDALHHERERDHDGDAGEDRDDGRLAARGSASV